MITLRFIYCLNLATHSYQIPLNTQEMIPVRPSQQYVPRVYGFKINQSSLYFRNNNEDDENRAAGSNSRRSNQSSRQGGGRR